MEPTPELLRALRDDLAELTALHALSGSEGPVVGRLRELFAPLVDDVTVDHMGNLIARRGGADDAPHVVVAAHSDEIGAVVANVEPDGFLRLHPVGGVQARLLEGRPVWVNGHPGVVGARSGHMMSAEEASRAARIEDLFVDLGVDSPEEVASMGVRIGDPIVVLSELRDLAGTRVAGKGIDNRAGCVVLLHLLRRLAGQRLPCRLTDLVTVQEEVGLRGATVAFAGLQPDLAIVVDTAPAAGTPDTRGATYAARIGSGVLVVPVNGAFARGLIMSPPVVDAIVAAAERAGVPYHLAVGGGGVTDAAAAHLAGRGIPTFQLNIARRYSHSPVEVLDLRDVAATIELVEQLLLHPPATDDLAFV